MAFPKQDTSRKATIARRDRVSIYADGASGGSSQPSYVTVVSAGLPAEVLQINGGEIVRGKQMEAVAGFVIGLRYQVGLSFTAKCKVTILSGPYTGQVCYVHRVLFETEHGRPQGILLHCKRTE